MKTTFSTIALAVAAGIILSACQKQAATEEPQNNSETISVKTITPGKQVRKKIIEVSGLLSTTDEALYSFKIGGVIDKIYVREGQFYNKGQILASLKQTEIEAGVAQAKLGLEKARRDHDRVLRLFADSVATLEQVQNSQTALELAEKQLAAISFNKSYASVVAPEGGFVKRKLANDGEVVAAGSPILAISQAPGHAWVLKAGLADQAWAMVKEGDLAELKVDAFPRKKFRGKVLRKAMAADQGTGSFTVEIAIDLEGLKPAVGMFGSAVLQTGLSSEMFSIPYEALVEADGMQAYVFFPIGNGKVRRQEILIDEFDSKEVLVRQGLEEIRQVVVTNAAFLNENATIQIVNN